MTLSKREIGEITRRLEADQPLPPALLARLQAIEPAVELSVVVPVYNEAPGLPDFLDRLTGVLNELGVAWEIVCVNDGSTDGSLELLTERRRAEPRLRIVDLSRNFGKEAATTAGLDHALGRAVVLIDADLQHPPEAIGEMLAAWREGAEVVCGVRRGRSARALRSRLASRGFRGLFNAISEVSLAVGTGDFRLMDRAVVEALREIPERNRFMQGLFAWVGFRQAVVEFDVEPRRSGSSRWRLGHLWGLALDGITSFSTLPLRLTTWFGLVVAFGAFLYGSYVIIRTLALGIDVPGYASLMAVILFFSGVQLFTIGVLGGYVGRTYVESKRRPLYVVRAASAPAAPAGGRPPKRSG